MIGRGSRGGWREERVVDLEDVVSSFTHDAAGRKRLANGIARRCGWESVEEMRRAVEKVFKKVENGR